MSQDERQPVPDDGEIHEWLDGELSASRSAELEALTHSWPEFARRVAEARGLIAASSRILGALDDMPAGVLPDAAAARAAAAAAAVNDSSTFAARGARRWSWRRVSSIAALLMVGVTGVVVVQRKPELSETDAVVRAEAAVDAASSAPAEALAAESVSSEAAPAAAAPSVVAPTVAAPAETPPAAARSARMPVIARTAAPTPAAARESSASRLTRDAQLSVLPQTLAAAVPPNTLDTMSVAAAAKASELLSQSQSQSQLQSQRERSLQRRAAASTPSAPRFSSGSALSASGVSSADAVGGEAIQSDVLPSQLLFGVQRVECAPNCVQQRIEIARDGRLRRWIQSLGEPTIADASTLDEAALTALGQRMTALRLDTLPAVLQLDGNKCYSVGSLRESLRVSFVHNNAPRQVMGLPWCTDGNHVLDRAAQLIEEAAALKLGGVSRLIRE